MIKNCINNKLKPINHKKKQNKNKIYHEDQFK